jgi:CheY-like chemotaxis protein
MQANFVQRYKQTRFAGLVKRISAVLCLCLSAYHSASIAAVWQITYPKALHNDSQDFAYAVELLDLALQKTGVRYELNATQDVILQQKALGFLQDNRKVNVVWTMTDEQRENDLLPIRIPIFRGLIGWRVLLHHRNNQHRFAGLSRTDLADKYYVQGMNWPDTKILRNNGFNVINATDYHEAFTLTRNQQADFLPRSVIEVTGELTNSVLTEDLMLESRYVLRYPAATYFFVNKSNVILAKLLARGLQRAIDDGSFNALFESHYMPVLDALNVPDRITIDMDNPLLPIVTPVGDMRLWYTQ